MFITKSKNHNGTSIALEGTPQEIDNLLTYAGMGALLASQNKHKTESESYALNLLALSYAQYRSTADDAAKGNSQ